MIKTVDTNTFQNEVIQSDVPVVVDFFATWCGPCKLMSPILDQLAEEFESTAKIVKLDVDQSKEIATQYSVKGMPTFIFFKDGEIVDRIMGSQPKDELKSKISAMIE
ncbi:MAG: thioredoxin [Defluviitaleaceae bacterium]|nr:thioredoxin [Defluviitaleaceae bacterium]